MGFTLAPMADDKVMKSEELQALSKQEQEAKQAAIEVAQTKLETILRQAPKWEKELRDGLRKLERETVEDAITPAIQQAKTELENYPAAYEHLDAIRDDLVENVSLFSTLA